MARKSQRLIVCTACAETRPVYAKELCSPCYSRDLRLRNLEKIRARDRNRRARAPEKFRARDRERYWRHREKRVNEMRRYRERNKEYFREYDAARARDSRRRAYNQERREKNRERIREIDRRRYYRHKDKRIALVNARRAHKGKATPQWLTPEQLQEIVNFYAARPPGHHVDHIIPLKGETVCGLHVPWNLQYLPATENLRKSNKLIPR